MTAAQYPQGMPSKQGLYDPRNERDACGIGFVAHARGQRSHEIVRMGLDLLENLTHRGAAGCDPCSGDGAGILMQIPHALLARACGEQGMQLPAEGDYAVGMFFLPMDEAERRACEAVVERVVAEESLHLLGWRDVPTDAAHIGPEARKTLPAVRQLFLARDGQDEDAFERKLYRTRKRIEKAVSSSSLEGRSSFYAVSLSSRTIVYKGLLIPDQIPLFFLDLADPAAESAIVLVHSRFSTNTFPTWARSHPYRMICHNGEINALRGNVNWMRVREGGLHSHLFGDDPEALFPIIGEDQSDSACLDNALEFLVMGGRSLPHAMMMLMPEAWTNTPDMDPEVHDFFEYHSAIMEPWDGPAAVAFSNGRQVGAILDRNGLRPGRYLVTHDDLVVLASEAGALPFAPEEIRTKGRLGPGKMIFIDTVEGRIWEDEEIKTHVASQQPYGEWVREHQVRLSDLPEVGYLPSERASLAERESAFGYTLEELRMIVAPMAGSGQEPTGSMGTDTPLAVLSDRPQSLFKYFKQLFAQVTNPPIDPIREQLVMSLATEVGPRADVLEETPEHAHRLWLEQPILTDAELSRIRGEGSPFRAETLRIHFPVAEGRAGLGVAMDRLCAQAADAVRGGAGVLILSDRGVDDQSVPIPSLLAAAGVHHHLIREGLRTQVGLVLETGEPREVHHFAVLLGYGVEAINPYLVFETLEAMVHRHELPVDLRTASKQYTKAVGKGLLKILSKMGISTLQSYCGAQIFEAIGLSEPLVERFFAGTASRIGGVGLEEIAEEAIRRHQATFAAPAPADRLDPGGEYHYRVQGEHHNWSPMAIAKLQHAARGNDYRTFQEFSEIVNGGQGRFNLRGLFDFDYSAAEGIALEEVEPASEIVKRFCTGAMSFGSISAEAHETLAVAMNRIGGRSNTGEGGEDPKRFLDDRNSKIKQVASGRFGVTTEYLVNAEELQIKIAQGAKPGEGGQLPGHKVDEIIARTRHSTPGVSLISPPPHHDIYSIEDLAQLIYDLKTVNPRATISVKLVAEVGVGTVAAGVAKAHADLIVIAGDSGGTGASPVSSIKHAGIPWELGLAETQQTLVLNDLRGRVRIQTDGQLRTGRDVAIAALLGAEEFGFATAPLIVEGCIMMRKCHLNTCPVGIATQDPVLRAKFNGEPEHIVNYFFFVAEELREIMARLGFRTLDEMVGRSDRLHPVAIDHWKGGTLDLSPVLHRPDVDPEVAIHKVQDQDHGLERSLDHELIRLATPAIERAERVTAELPITNVHRTVGAMLSGVIAKKFGNDGLPEDTIRLRFTGSAGQSFGAFAVQGVTMTLEGEANDYVGKGLSGGRLVVFPPRQSTFVPEETIVIGNTVLYGATAGEAFFRGTAGERFAVRNSGARAVVEGVGDHGCEYMTGGVVVVLGKTGRNFGAGMSGGIAFVLDEAGEFERSCNMGLVELERVEEPADAELLRHLIERHTRYTGSARAKRILDHWEESLPGFIKVIPVEYKQILKKAAIQNVEAKQTVRKEMFAHG